MEKPVEYRILTVIREHYDETAGLLIGHNIRHVFQDRVWIAQVVVAFESDESYIIHTETLRVDLLNGVLIFTLLTEHDLDLTEA